MKDSILAAATEEIRLHGSSFRMEDLARRLNISKRTLYENFRSKNEILERILSEKARDFYEQHQAILADEQLTCAQKLKQYFSVKSDLYNTLNGEHFREMFNSIPYLVDQAMATFDKDWDQLQAYLETQKQIGVIKNIDIDVLIMMLRGIARSIVYDNKRNPEECLHVLPEAIDILLRGILNEGADNA